MENRETADSGRAEYIHKQWQYLSERSLQALVALESPSHIVRYANPAFARLAGEKAQRMIGRPFARAVPQGLGDGSLPLLDRVYGTRRAETLNEAITRHEVRTAHDGGEGVAVAAQFRPEVILMDPGMPKMDGFEAVRRIRAQPWGREPMIIALRGRVVPLIDELTLGKLH